MNKKERMNYLIEEINKLNYHYYTIDEPLVSDKEYDKLYDELKSLEKETGIIKSYSPTQKVGGEILDGFEKHTHLGPLWSLEKAQSFEELRDWEDRVKRRINEYNKENETQLKDPTYVMEYKFDGLSINLTYDEGKLVQAATRGNGRIGEGILPQVKVIKSIPKKIKFKGLMEVQGEALMPISAFEEYNKTAEEPLKNARNAAAGALRNLDTSITKERNLAGYFYNIGYIDGKEFNKHTEVLEFLKDNLIPVFPYMKEFKSIEEMIREIEYQEEKRHDLDVLTDGLVIKVKDILTRDALGYTNRFPRWAVAYKFEAEEVTTTLLDVIWNVGRTGKLTPSAVLEPVEIGGATIQRATLNNYDDIERKKLRLKSRVWLRRSNDVIPEILGVVDNENETEKIEKPEICPACDTKLIQDGVHIFCPNDLTCPPQLIAKLVHFSSRDAMNIEGLSEKTAELLMNEMDIKDLSDIYRLEFDELMELEGFKEKKSENLLNAIEKSKDVSLDSFIYALGIDNVGSKTAMDLANYYKSLDSIINADMEELLLVGEVGEIIAKNITDFFSDERALEMINSLLELGVKPHYEDIVVEDSIFMDKTIVITGAIDGVNRNQLKDKIVEMGGRVTGSVSGRTDYLVAGENVGSKYNRAVELNVEIIDGEKIKEILNL